MADLRKAAEMALEDICGAKLCEVNSMSSRAEMLRLMDKAAEALRQALAQPEQDPVDLARVGEVGVWGYEREWVGLTDEDLKPLCDEWKIIFGGYVNDFAKAIEAKLKEKNA